MVAMHMKIFGRVQGVWFRANTQEAAQRHGLTGWVRNTPDGAVEVHAQGEHEAVDNLLSWCYQGPPGARVDKIDFKQTSVDDSLRGFSIRY
jgi:acylphosphatase